MDFNLIIIKKDFDPNDQDDEDVDDQKLAELPCQPDGFLSFG